VSEKKHDREIAEILHMPVAEVYLLRDKLGISVYKEG
jgi:hypothetical protein